MGRGNPCTHYECEGLYYLDIDYIHRYSKITRSQCCNRSIGFDYDEESKSAKELQNADIAYNFDGAGVDWAYDQFESQTAWEDMVSEICQALMVRFKSFQRVDRWRNSRHIVLESAFFEIAVEDGEWCAASMLLERHDVDDVGSNRTLMRRHYKAYLEAIKTALVDVWGEAIGYGGAWVSGERYVKS
ncbi:MAG: hypothetical protein FWD84_07325 [Oscillospiraceae bacterium]|nr:hypothetical protein [Oscillospiraceae bacterium]